MKGSRSLSASALLLLAALLASGAARAESFVRPIERPVVRFLLLETAEGRAVVDRLAPGTERGTFESRWRRHFRAELEQTRRWLEGTAR